MILLLENKTIRATESKIDFSSYNDIMEIVSTDEECDDLLDSFLCDPTVFNKYQIIMIHESIYREEWRKELFKKLENYCEDKSLVKFSGSNTSALVTNESLQLSDKNFYTNLEFFLQMYRDNKSNILMLAYGRYWDLNPLLNYLEKLNLFIENIDTEKEIRSSKFKQDFGLFSLKRILKDEEYQLLLENIDFKDQKVSMDAMIILASNFKKLIQEKSK